MKITSIIITAFIILFSSTGFAQSKIFDNVLEVELRNTVEILNNKEIVGYAFFYKLDESKKTSTFRLAILDENLKEIGNNEFEGSKDLSLKMAVYESNKIFLSFYDKEKTNGYSRYIKAYSLDGKEVSTIPYDRGQEKKGMSLEEVSETMKSYYGGIDIEPFHIKFTNIEDKGVIFTCTNNLLTGGCDIQLIDINGKLKWENKIISNDDITKGLLYLGSTEKNALFRQTEQESPKSKRLKELTKIKPYKSFLVGLDLENGKELFKHPFEINGLSYEPLLLKKNIDGKYIIVSTIYSSDEKTIYSKPIGLSIGEVNNVGEFKVLKDYNYLKDLGDVLNMKNESKSEDGYIKIHNAIVKNNNDLIIIGEYFTKRNIGDMFILRVSNKFNTLSFEKIEKEKESITSIPSAMLPVGFLERILFYYHEFGYLYTDENENQKTILVKGSLGDEKFGTSAVTLNETTGFTTKHFEIQKEKNVTYSISRARPGFVLISKYNSKNKTLSLNLEKVN